MILVFGGNYQGKTAFAERLIGEIEAECDISPVSVPDFSEEIREAMERGEDPDAYLEKRLPELAGRVVVMSDHSQGLVPMEAEQRAYREACGRAMIRLARESEEVYRVFCGIGTRLK